MKHLIVKTIDGWWVAFNERAGITCSDKTFEDCVIKLGLLGHNMNTLSPNSREGKKLQLKIMEENT